MLLVPGPIPRLEANIAIPHANLSEWLDSAASGETAARDESATSDKSGRLIPNTVIPVEMLTKLNFDIKLETGPLGLPDPLFSDQSLIDRLSLVAVLEGEELQVNVKELLGSRGVTSGTASVSGADGVALAK